MIKFISKITLVITMLLVLATNLEAAESFLPEVMVSNPKAWYGTPATNVYGGVSGSEAIYNPIPIKNSATISYGPSISFPTAKPNRKVELTYNSNYSQLSAQNKILATAANSSVEMWAKWEPSPSGYSQTLYSEQQESATFTTRYAVLITPSGIPYFAVQTWDGASTWTWHSTTTPTGNTWNPNFSIWHHIVAVFSSTNGMHMYIDGVEYYTDTNTTPYQNVLGWGPAMLGDATWANYEYNGSVDEVRLYKRALGQTEINEHLGGTFSNNANLVGYWNFNQGSTTTAVDLTSSYESPVNIDHNAKLTDITVNSDAPVITKSQTPVTIPEQGQTSTDPSAKNYGYDQFGFKESSLVNCVNGIIFGTNCFLTNSLMNNVRAMNSQTRIDGKPATEVATLLYPSKPLIVGDAYLGDMDPNNFAYWGKNLVQNSGAQSNSESFWGLKAYTNLADSQIEGFRSKIETLIKEAKVSGPPTPNVYLQTTNMNAPNGPYPSGNDESNLYPNGKIWSVLDVDAPSCYGSNRTFYGIGTLIYSYTDGNGTLNIGSGACSASKIKWTKRSNTDQLGIIVMGDLQIGPNSIVEAAIFCTGTMTIGDNATLKGSFVAHDFSIGTGVRLMYDRNLDMNMPPGFGELNMPFQTQN